MISNKPTLKAIDVSQLILLNNKQQQYQFIEEFNDFDHLLCANENNKPLVINFKSTLTNDKEIEWKTLFVNGSLYVDIPSSLVPDGSRDSFISLLEFAEQKLECERVFVCMKKNRCDRCKLSSIDPKKKSKN